PIVNATKAIDTVMSARSQSCSAILTPLYQLLPMSPLSRFVNQVKYWFKNGWSNPHELSISAISSGVAFSPACRYAGDRPLMSRKRKVMNVPRINTGIKTPRGRNSSCVRSEEHTSELQSRFDLVCRL